MSVIILCEKFLLSQEEVELLWKKVREETGVSDDEVTVRCVREETIKELNKKYRGIDRATNGLTFSYGDGQHDIALCLLVGKREAEQGGFDWSDYVAWLLVHTFLHAAGMDHTRSDEEDKKTLALEKKILQLAGFNPVR